MSKETYAYNVKTGEKLHIRTGGDRTGRFEADCGEYGTLIFNSVIGGEVVLIAGTKQPVFNFIIDDDESTAGGLRGVDGNARSDDINGDDHS
jgi:hypothetical protein